ncbi:PREDICTED: kelch-like protein 21 [Acropora digitifera]|uniref:kelch-like protein 21 n=1 Tax=Acropora digitifera TaxID=70779 RepID=UPI000779F380|nr:PREDICTED: kelch-like protein 21 [Acropora digitifera]
MADSENKFSGVLKTSILDTAEALFFTDENHGSTILKGLFASYKDGKYVDISLKIGPERTLRAHRAVLASFSPYFEALLGDNWKEGNKEEIEIPGLDEGAVSDLIEFAYTGKINIDKDNVLTLLEAADYLGIEFVKN